MRNALNKLLALTVGLATTFAVYGSYAYVTSSAAETTETNSPSPTVTYGASVAANALGIACGTVFGENSASVPSDTNSNTYTAFGSDVTDGSFNSANCWFMKQASTSTPTVTIHWTGTTDTSFNVVLAYTGNVTSMLLVDHNTKILSSSSSSQTCNSVTATKAGQLMVAFVALTNAITSIAPGNGETERYEEMSFHQVQVEDKISTGAGAMSPQWTLNTADTGLCVVGLFDVPSTATINAVVGPTKVPGRAVK